MRGNATQKIWRQLRVEGVGALFITSPENIRFFTGFTGSEAVLLLMPKEALLVVDGRYTSQASGECKNARIIESRDKIGGAAEQIVKRGIKTVGFEQHALTVFQHGELIKKAAVTLVPESILLEKIRSRKNKKEINLIKKSASISSGCFLEIEGEVKAGVTERSIAHTLEFEIMKRGSDGVPFPFIVASGKRGALPHGLSSGKRIQKGEMVTIDFGAVYQGYCSDETCTLVVGKPTRKQKRIYQAVKDAHDKAISKVRPGIKAYQIDSAARGLLEKAGLGKYFRHGTGHGVGLAIHEEPKITADREDIIEEGMVFTIEPGVYIPGWGGVRIEDMIRVTGQGCELMSSVPKGLRSV